MKASLFLFVWSCLVIQTFANPGSPLFISQYLPDHPEVAHKLSEVHGIWPLPSYSGYITVNETTFSNMFFWFFPAQNKDPKAPILLWLQGGPGGPSMFGLFAENGPFSVAADGKTLIPRKWTWNLNYGMLFIDNPVGTGWSFTQTDDGFVENQPEVGRDLYSALSQFFQVFTEYKDNDFYVTGESYAGKYIPAICYTIYQNNQKSSQKINLKGLAIGDGAIDPLTQFTGFGPLLYYLGMADEAEAQHIEEHYSQPIAEHIAAGEWLKAFLIFDEFLNGDFYPYPTYYKNITGITNYYNFIDPDYGVNPWDQFLDLESTRSAIHTGNIPFSNGNATVESHLLEDWMKTMSPVMPTLLENYKVLVYNGQLDIILGPALAEKYYRLIEWSGQDEYLSAQKQVWTLNGQVVGYVRQVKNFVQAVVRNAGHLLPADQPEAAFDMITRFVESQPFK